MSSRPSASSSRILILDFGAQYSQLIARRVREGHVYCELQPADMTLEAIKAFAPTGIIFSGGPSSVLDHDAPDLDERVLELGIPILGICYGLQLLVHTLGGRIEAADDREYGRATLKIERDDPLFEGLSRDVEQTVWMSHGDRVLDLPEGMSVIASSGGSPFAAAFRSGTVLGRAVSSRGGSYRGRDPDPRKFRPWHLWLHSVLDDGVLRRRGDRRDS